MAGHSRYASTHASSSAFSAFANPHEDWTKITDLTERRRIQNRIAQRNYRKKLKRRLEDLERRAGSSSGSPEQQHSDVASPASKDSHQRSQSIARQSSKHGNSRKVRHMSPEPLPPDEHLPPSPSSRPPPVSSPPALSSYPTCLPATSYLEHEYQSPSYNTAHQNSSYEYQYRTDDSRSFPPTLPVMLPPGCATEQETTLGEDDLMNPFTLNYASLAGLNVPTTLSYASPSSQSHPYEQRYSRTNALFVQSITERSNHHHDFVTLGRFPFKESDLEPSLVRTLDDLITKSQYLPYIICDVYKLE